MYVRSVRARALLLVVLLCALGGLCVWYGSLGPDPSAWALPDTADLGADYDRYVGDRVTVGGTVVSVDPVVVESPGGDLRLTVDGVSAETVEPGDNLRVYGVAEPDRTIRALNAVVVPPGRFVYTVTASFVAGLWVLGRIVAHWRVSVWGLVPRTPPLRVLGLLRELLGRGAD